MCLGTPAKIEKIEGDQALVSVGGAKKKINIGLVPGLKVGDWVVVHAGFALQKLSERVREYEILFKR